MSTANTIIRDAVAEGLKLPKTNVQNDILSIGVQYYNKCGKLIFEEYQWENRKEVGTEYTPDSDGIITLGAEVDTIRAIRPISTADSDARCEALKPEDDVNAYIRGVDISPGYYRYLPDDDDGYRRIQVYVDENYSTYKIIAYNRFVKATIEDAYDADDPTATPTDYRVIQWPIDHCEHVLVEYIADMFRDWDGQPKTNEWREMLQAAIRKLDKQRPTEHIVNNDSIFSDLGDCF